LLDNSPIKDLRVDCLRDSQTQEIVWPDDMVLKCNKKSLYILIPRWPQYPEDQTKDPHYQVRRPPGVICSMWDERDPSPHINRGTTP
jgi:hypothetical protein